MAEDLQSGIEVGAVTVNGTTILWKTAGKKGGKLEFKDYALPSNAERKFKKPMRRDCVEFDFAQMLPATGFTEIPVKTLVTSFSIGNEQVYDSANSSSQLYAEGPFYVSDSNVDYKLDDLSEAKLTITGTGTNTTVALT